MMTQSVPSETNVAHPPAPPPASITVPAVFVLIGLTFDDAESTAWFDITFTFKIRPVQLDAAGNVNTHAEPVLLLINQAFESTTVWSAVRITGAEPAK